MDEKELLDLFLNQELTLRETLVKEHLESYNILKTEKEQRDFIVTLVSRLRGNEGEQWI